jgi:uncharacterized membrane protein YgdD (TMEM256/DUF423 family)
MNMKTTLITGIIMAALGVAIGAFGAHGLKEILAENNREETFELAVRYQFYHAFALLVTGVLMGHFSPQRLKYAALFFALGIVFFSGSLYILSLSGITVLGAVTPIGGVFFIVGWIVLLTGVVKK